MGSIPHVSGAENEAWRAYVFYPAQKWPTDMGSLSVDLGVLLSVCESVSFPVYESFQFVLKQFLRTPWCIAACEVKKEKEFELISPGHEHRVLRCAVMVMCSQLTREQLVFIWLA